jgi:hypothetical protein
MSEAVRQLMLAAGWEPAEPGLYVPGPRLKQELERISATNLTESPQEPESRAERSGNDAQQR